MKRLTKNTFFVLLALLSLTIILMASFNIPNWLLNRDYESHFNTITTVPQSYYTASNTAMAKKKSELLSSLDRMKLITGIWDSTSKEATSNDAILNESEAIALAKEKIQYLFERNLYPCSLNSGFNNWYSWTTDLYLYQDNTFHTYNTVLWVITFTKYDNSATHTVLMTDDGMLLAAQVNSTSDIRFIGPTEYKNVDLEFLLGSKKITVDAFTKIPYTELLQSIHSVYPSIPLSYIKDSNCYLATLNPGNSTLEQIVVYQYSNSTDYGIGLINPTP